MKIVALDFETANECQASACSVGLFVYEDGEFVDSYYWLIKPSSRYNYFTNTWVHGLTKEDVADAKEFYEYYDELKNIISGAIICAHNACFDIGVLNACCDTYGLDHFENEYIDTVAVSRRVYPELFNHRLNTVSEYLGITLDHHNALSDCRACLMILLEAMSLKGLDDIYEFAKSINLKLKVNH